MRFNISDEANALMRIAENSTGLAGYGVSPAFISALEETLEKYSKHKHSGFYSTHQFNNGVMTTVESLSDEEISIRIQGENEQMLTDIVTGRYEALCLAHSILSVLTNHSDIEGGS